jgi:translation initiation factor 4G
MDLTRGDMQYIPTTDQFGQQMQMPGPYMMQQQFHPQQQQQHAFNPNAPPHQHQMFSPPPQNMPAPFTPAQSRSPMNQPMSRSASVASEINTHSQPPATPSPAPKEESSSTFIKPKKSSAIKIVNPDTKTEITFPKVAAAKAPERSPSPAVKAASAKAIPRATHSPAPSLDVDRPSSGMGHKSKEEIAEEMKAKVQKTLEEAKRKEAEKEEAERIEREKKIEEERKAKEEADRLEKERKEAEERAEQERIQREKEETERKAEEERIAAQKAKEEEEARIAKEKAEEEAALEAARLAKERAAAEEQEAKAKEEAELAAATPAAEDTPPSEERRPSLGGARKTAPPPLALKSDVSVSDGLQSAALKTAAFIKQDAFLTTKYPDGFKSPDPAINAKFGNKGFHYNVEFLYQFKDIYKDKPTEDWDVKIKETMGDMDTRNQRSMGGAGRAVSTSGPMFQMGSFGKSSPITRHPSGIPPLATGGLPFGGMGSNFQPRIPPRSISSGQGMQAPSSPSGRTQSKSQRQSSRRAPQPPPPPPEPPVEPLPVNPNRWKPQRAESSLGPPLGAEAVKLTPEVVQRKVKSLLNKLTLEKFDKITDQILEIASQSRTETDGRTLRQIIQLTFEKATDEPNFSEMYALFCRKIMETIDPNITDPAVLNKDGQPLTGGQLFRKYLLNRCQEEFERGWKVNLPPKPDENAVGKEAELLSDAYYVAAKAKRQGLGLVKFIGELFKLNMLIEKIMYVILFSVLISGTNVLSNFSASRMIHILNRKKWRVCVDS